MQPQPSPHPDFITALRRINPLDWLMLVLAVVSIGLLVYETWGDPSERVSHLIGLADYSICGLFAIEFIWRWSRTGWEWGYVRRNWYEILGMIPLQQPALRGFRLFRVMRIAILLARFGMASDRAFGDEFTYRLINRFKKGIVDSISGAVTVAVLDHVSQVMARGTYTRNVSKALEANQVELRAMILEKLRDDRQTGRLARLPFYDDIVDTVIAAVMRVLEQVLNDPRTDALIADMLQENLNQIRSAVQLDEQAAEMTRRLRHEQQPL